MRKQVAAAAGGGLDVVRAVQGVFGFMSDVKRAYLATLPGQKDIQVRVDGMKFEGSMFVKLDASLADDLKHALRARGVTVFDMEDDYYEAYTQSMFQQDASLA